MRIMDSVVVLSKFRGSILGALVGDCCGAPFEGQRILEGGERLLLRKNLDQLEGPFFSAPEKAYSDDTVMSRAIARTLIDHKQIDQTDLCKHFVRDYVKEPNRGYGEGVVKVFQKLRQNRFTDVLTPALMQFQGTGSFGNGGAMRVSPIALYCHNQPLERLTDMVVDSTVTTHTHTQGINGSILQALAVHSAFACDPAKPLDTADFARKLQSTMQKLELANADEFEAKNLTPFTEQLKIVVNLLGKDDPSGVEVVNKLGTDLAALYSVPTAIYCFLRSQSPIQGIDSENPFRRAIEYAISLGGDTDTIASMTGAISGAFYGDSVIPANLLRHCEQNEELKKLAEDLYAASEAKDWV